MKNYLTGGGGADPVAVVHVSDEYETEYMEVDRLIRRAKMDPPRFYLGAESLPAPSALGAIPVGVIPETPRASIAEGMRIPSPI